MMKTYRMVYLLVTAAVLFCGLWGGTALAPVLFAVLAVLPVLSVCGLYLSVSGLSLSVSGNRSCRCGQQIKIKLNINTPFFRPAGKVQINLTEENHVFCTKKEMSCWLELSRGKQHEFAFSPDTSVCGTRIIRIQEMVCYDLLGLFSCRKPVSEEFTCIVYPYEAQLYISLNKNREKEQPGDIYDGKKSGTDVSEVFGLREYKEGDSLQSIHWKLSGKMGQLIVREFGRPVNYHTLLLLAPALHYGSQEFSEHIVSAVFDLGVSVSRALLNQNMAHFVGCGFGGELVCISVDSLHSYEEMLLKLMHYPVQKNGDDLLFSFISQQLYRQYTKVVYVTGAVNEKAAQNLSVLVDLTVIQASDGPSGYLMGDDGYTVIRVSTEHIRNIEHLVLI